MSTTARHPGKAVVLVQAEQGFAVFQLVDACHLVGGIYRKERSEVLVIA